VGAEVFEVGTAGGRDVVEMVPGADDDPLGPQPVRVEVTTTATTTLKVIIRSFPVTGPMLRTRRRPPAVVYAGCGTGRC
jgi:hypothetical protein